MSILNLCQSDPIFLMTGKSADGVYGHFHDLRILYPPPSVSYYVFFDWENHGLNCGHIAAIDVKSIYR